MLVLHVFGVLKYDFVYRKYEQSLAGKLEWAKHGSVDLGVQFRVSLVMSPHGENNTRQYSHTVQAFTQALSSLFQQILKRWV